MTTIAEQVREQAAKVAEQTAAAIRAMPLPAAGWQPIETAREGDSILVWSSSPNAFRWLPLAAYRIGDRWYRPGTVIKLPYDPTHWMPLPAPPEDAP